MASRKDHVTEEAPSDVQPIPGAHDHTAEAHTQPGIVGTTGYGVDVPPATEDLSIDEETRKQIRWEGGGRVEHRKNN